MPYSTAATPGSSIRPRVGLRSLDFNHSVIAMLIVLHLIGIGIGLFMIVVAVFNWETWFFDAESRAIEMIGGQEMVRWYWGIGGLLVIAAAVTDWIWGWGL